MDLLIINGEFPDFEEGNFKKGNIGIKDGIISYIGKELPLVNKKTIIIDAKDNIVSPGFIDIHMHEEDVINEGKKYIIAEMMLKMGVTSCLGGNCGIQRQRIKELKTFIDEMDGSPVNYMMLTGYNTLREKAGVDNYEEATEEECNQIRKYIKEELEEGAFGISLGLEYSPGINMEEALFATRASEDDNLYISAHYRKDSIYAIEAITEMINIARLSKKKFQISHLSSCSAMGQMDEALELINNEIVKNQKLNYDMYPYSAFSTYIGSAVFDDGCFELWNKDYSSIMLSDDPYKNVFCNKELFEKARKEYPQMLAVAFVMEEDEITKALINKHGMIASDAIISNGKGHPRASGTFPRVLGKYVREENVIQLIDALRKITLEPAKRLGIQNRAEIKVGNIGDITIFNPDTIIDKADFENIHQDPLGIEYVIIGGDIGINKGRIVNNRLGKFINYR